MKKLLLFIIICAILLIVMPMIVEAVKIPNPLGEGTEITDIIAKITEALKIIAIPVGVIMIIISGIQYMTAGGNEEKATKAKKTILYTIIGVAIVIAADFIVDLIKEITGYK
jgi:hypothetical protein